MTGANRSQGRAAFAFIFVTVLLDMLALGIIIPVLPNLIVEFEGGNTASGAAMLGVFSSVFALMQFVFSPVLGSLSDRFGRRRVILLSCAGLGLDYVLMAMAPSLWWLVGVASMIVQGGLVGRLVSALGERRALAVGFLAGAVGNLIFGLAPTGALFLIGIPLAALYGVANPALQSMMTRRVSSGEQGRLQGAQGSLMGIATMTAPLLFTQAFAAAVGPFRGWNIPGVPFLIAAALLVAALLVARQAGANRAATLQPL